MQRLQDKVCVVTGAGSRSEEIGLGRAAAILFAREGGTVVVNDVNEEAAELTVSMIESEGGRASHYTGDLTDWTVAQGLVDHATSRWGRVDVLHNNIGIGGSGSVVDAEEELWDRVMAVNVKTVMLTCKAAVPAMAATGGGSITTVSSISALRPRGLTPYSTSKGAVISLSLAMAIDHAAQGIRVNCIVPGPVYSPMARRSGMSAEQREQRRLASPLAREGSPWDIAHAAVYFSSEEARWVTGTVLPVDGGVSLRSPDRDSR